MGREHPRHADRRQLEVGHYTRGPLKVQRLSPVAGTVHHPAPAVAPAPPHAPGEQRNRRLGPMVISGAEIALRRHADDLQYLTLSLQQLMESLRCSGRIDTAWTVSHREDYWKQPLPK